MSEVSYQQVVEQIKEKLDIVDTISKFVVLKKAGRNFQGLCPFHNEKTPSFVVTPSKQIFKCFGCGEGGDVFTFLMKINNQTFAEMIEEQAANFGIELPKTNSKTAIQNKQEKERLYDAMELATKFFKQNLESNQKALEYLEKRGINEIAISKFSLGLAPKGNFDLKNYLTDLGFTIDELLKAGLIYEKDGNYLDRFKNRIIIPIKDINSNTIAFGARAILDGQMPKYINSPESIIYNKSSVLFGLNRAKETIQQNDSIIFMEGYFDVISAHLGGIENAVATCGTALTPQHIKLISRFCPSRRIFLAFDTDSAGKKAIEHGAEVIKNIFSSLGDIKQFDSNYKNDESVCEIRVVQEIEGKDPDEFIREFGGEQYLKKVASAPLLLDYQLDKIYSSIEGKLTPQEKSQYVIQITDILYQIKNPVILDEYIKVASFKLDVSINNLKTQIQNKQNEDFEILQVNDEKHLNFKKATSDNQFDLMEENLLKLAFVADSIEKRNYFKEKIASYKCQNEENTRILESIDKNFYEVNNVDELAKKLFLGFYNEEHIQKKISDNIFSSQVFNNLSFEDYKKAIDETISRLNSLNEQQKRNELKKLLKDTSLSTEEKLQISTQIFSKLKNQ
ncbi:MAG: DNA primase [Candidatus Gastranaerophilales bacterium]|nr:DNA primase [Candidatus Gastranaerophilales bacterium]